MLGSASGGLTCHPDSVIAEHRCTAAAAPVASQAAHVDARIFIGDVGDAQQPLAHPGPVGGGQRGTVLEPDHRLREVVEVTRHLKQVAQAQHHVLQEGRIIGQRVCTQEGVRRLERSPSPSEGGIGGEEEVEGGDRGAQEGEGADRKRWRRRKENEEVEKEDEKSQQRVEEKDKREEMEEEEDDEQREKEEQRDGGRGKSPPPLPPELMFMRSVSSRCPSKDKNILKTHLMISNRLASISLFK